MMKVHNNHDKHAGHSPQMFLKKFWVSLVLTIPVIFYSHLGREILRLPTLDFPGSQYLPLVLGTVVFSYGGFIFLQSARVELRNRQPGMMTLIALAITTAYLYSVYATLLRNGEDLFWELTTLITIMLVGHYLEMRAVSGAGVALKELSRLLPDQAELIKNDRVQKVPLESLKVGDLVLVRPGSKVPADGIVLEGQSEASEAMITGESKPVNKGVGNKVIAGTINGNGSLKIRITEIGQKTFLAGVMRLVAEAQASKSKLQILSDRAAYYLTLIAIFAGGLTFIIWLGANAEFGFALERLVAVLVIACPHALGLAIPLVATISTSLAARNGFLIKQRLALEQARNLDLVIFDKTGTLTKGEYGVTEIFPNQEILRLAASVNQHSEHYIAKAIVQKAQAENIKLLNVEDFQAIPGKGARGKINNSVVLVGGEAILETLENPSSSPTLRGKKEVLLRKTIVYVIKDGKLLGAIGLADLIREESRQAVAELKKMGIKVAMITGDSEDVASWVARELGIKEYFARVLPDQKADKVKLLQQKGRRVAMVGDGINDAPALVQADVGIAIGAGTTVAIESAGIILVKNDPRDIPQIIRLSRLTYSKMLQNLWWAAGYNIVALPLAAGILASKGILLEPAMAALLMSLSTVIVALNAILLRKQKI